MCFNAIPLSSLCGLSSMVNAANMHQAVTYKRLKSKRQSKIIGIKHFKLLSEDDNEQFA